MSIEIAERLEDIGYCSPDHIAEGAKCIRELMQEKIDLTVLAIDNAYRIERLMKENDEIAQHALTFTTRIAALEEALQNIIERAEFKNSEYVTDIVCRIAREALEWKK
jgi:FtsZ-binding cell division protein ZapB